MCGRYVLAATPEELQALFGYLDADVVDFPPRYNIAPTQPIAIVRMLHAARRFTLVRWGLVPGFVKEPRKFGLLINARSESAETNGAFKWALRYRRCLVPASGFYEWQKGEDKRSQPFFVRPADGGVIAFAGLWETWLGADGSEIDSGCILTTAANANVVPIHDRMPVVIAPEDYERWLRSEESVSDLLRPPPDDSMEAIAVSDRVNAARNDDPGLIKPATATAPEAGLPLFDR